MQTRLNACGLPKGLVMVPLARSIVTMSACVEHLLGKMQKSKKKVNLERLRFPRSVTKL